MNNARYNFLNVSNNSNGTMLYLVILMKIECENKEAVKSFISVGHETTSD